jgi:hypothetical protein
LPLPPPLKLKLPSPALLSEALQASAAVTAAAVAAAAAAAAPRCRMSLVTACGALARRLSTLVSRVCTLASSPASASVGPA